MTHDDLDPSVCPWDKSDLVEWHDGQRLYYECMQGNHVFPARWGGMLWLPNFEEVDLAEVAA